MKKIAVNISRLLVGVTFVFSGFVKAVDPLGTQYKLQDYAVAMGISDFVPDWLTLCGSVALATLEFILGVMLLFAINRRLVTKLLLLIMAVMTLLTVWIYAEDPVSDCGCFGDAVVLTNGETLLKNIILLAMTALLAWKPLLMPRFVPLGTQWLISQISIFSIIGLAIYDLYYLPIIDFRPYSVGADIRKGMEIPEGAEKTEFETTFILEKNGERKEFTLDNYPDSTWTFIDSKTVVTKQGYVPPIHDFSLIRTEDGEDITDMVLDNAGYTFLLVSPHLENADESQFGNIDMIHEYACENNCDFYCLTASGEEGIEQWRDKTGAEYGYCNTDEITLKTIVRSNPGLVLLKKGVIVGKWSHNSLPDEEKLTELMTGK